MRLVRFVILKEGSMPHIKHLLNLKTFIHAMDNVQGKKYLFSPVVLIDRSLHILVTYIIMNVSNYVL